MNPMLTVVTSLDWNGGEVLEPVLEPLAEHVRSRLGEGALRWVTGAVEQSLTLLNDRIQDSLAPRSKFRELSQRIVISILLDLVKEEPFPVDRLEIDEERPADMVARGIALSDATRALRQMQRDWLVSLIDASRAIHADSAHLTPEIAASVTTTMDTWVATLTEAILKERRRVAQSGLIRARTTIEALIAVEPLDLMTGSAVLGLSLDRWHVSCAIGAPPGLVVDREMVDVAARSLARWAGLDYAVRYETSEGKTHLWATVEHPPTGGPAPTVEIPAPLVAGLGEFHRGAQGFRRSFIEAADALRHAFQSGRTGVLAYREAALPINLSRDAERARWFVEFELGALARSGSGMAEMRTTLRVFFAKKMRIAPAAEELFVHRNTLINRLERIEGILGHPLSERTAEIQAALTIAELYVSAEPGTPSA